MSRLVDPPAVPRRRSYEGRPDSPSSRSASPSTSSLNYARPDTELHSIDRASSSATPPYAAASSHHVHHPYRYRQHQQLPPLSYYDNRQSLPRARPRSDEGYFASGYAYGPPPPVYGYHHSHYAPAPLPPPPHLEPSLHRAPPLTYLHQGYLPAPPPLPPPAAHSNDHAEINWTDDAATKLTASVRRRCFNCCTTKTCTWRRSLLSAGKVLCNKCGLFERTHSRPRPDQFSGKRSAHPPPSGNPTARGRPLEAASHTEPPPSPPPPRSVPSSTPNGAKLTGAATTHEVPAPGPARYTGSPLARPGDGAPEYSKWDGEAASLRFRSGSPPPAPEPKTEPAPVASSRPGLRSLLNSPEAAVSRLPVPAR